MIKIDTGDINGGHYNCGDLTYSGHMVSVITCAFVVHRYLPQQLKMSGQARKVLKFILILLVVAQCLLIITARHHYSLDVVVSLYVMPLIWHFYET